MNTDLTPYALGSEDGEALWFFETLATFKATAEQTGGRFSLVEQMAPGGLPLEGPPDMEKVEAAAQEFGVDILGPPPGVGA
jgi:hypothetical protein